jgi:transposase-like protein
MSNPFRYFNSSPEVIRLVVMMYVRYPLSLRNVEDLLAERGIDISHETVRFWWNRFGPVFAAEIRKRRVAHMRGYPQRRWHLDEVFVKVNGRLCYLWRAVDHEGEVLEAVATAKRNKADNASRIVILQSISTARNPTLIVFGSTSRRTGGVLLRLSASARMTGRRSSADMRKSSARRPNSTSSSMMPRTTMPSASSHSMPSFPGYGRAVSTSSRTGAVRTGKVGSKIRAIPKREIQLCRIWRSTRFSP